MPAEVRIVDQKFYAKLNNGDNYDLNTSDFSTHLKGGVLEEIKAVFNVQLDWNYNLSSYDLLYSSTDGTIRIEKGGMNLINEGFSVGDEVKLSLGSVLFNGFISSINTSEAILNNVTIVSGSLTDGWHLDLAGTDYLTGLTKKTALKYDYGLIENNEPINFLSKLTNTAQTYLFEGIDHNNPLTFVDGVSFGNNKAAYSGSAKVAFVGLVTDKDKTNSQLTTQEFQIEHTFKINPFYRDGEIDSLKDIDVPPLDIFNGNMSLKYVFQSEFRTTLNNPNTSMISSYDTQLGSVGYLDESYNGYKNNYYTEGLKYTINSKDVDRIEITDITNVEFNIKSETNSFTSSTPVIIGHSAVVNSLSYVNSPNNYNDVWTNETLRAVTGDVSKSGTLIKNYLATYIDSSTINITFDIEFTGTQKSILEDNQDYLLYYTIQDPNETVDTGDKVTGRIDVNYYYKNNDVAGLFDFDVFEQYPHPEPFEEGVSVGFTDALTFNESGMMANGRFWVLNSANLNDLKFDIAVYKFDNDSWNSLRSLTIDLSDQQIVNGVQLIELDSTRGYVLKEDDIFNYLKVTTDNNDGTKQYYNIQVGYKIPWQSWLEFKNAPTSFYNKEKSFNGLNQKASNYSMVGTGLNTFVDAINGTFEDNIVANWNLTLLPYSPSTPNQIGSIFTHNPFGKSGFSASIDWGSPSMNETNKVYEIFINDTSLDVVNGQYYELVSYISLKDVNFDPNHLDNGSFYWLPSGYTKEECEITEFEIITDNLYSTDEPLESDWKKIRTYFKATSTGTVNFTLVEELKTDIATSTGGDFNLDSITFKAVEYGIKVLFDAVVDSTNYVKTSEEIKVYDYHEDNLTPTNFDCEIITLNEDGTNIANNIINNEFTEVNAVFTPLVPPTFTESVDMTEVATIWNRFAHGEFFNNNANVSIRRTNPTNVLTGWLLGQADDVDIFGDGTGNTTNKLASGLYTSTPNQILCNENNNAYYGCYSLDEYAYYSISGKMFSNSSDNDAIGYVVAMNVDENGLENSISLLCTTGGAFLGLHSSFNPNNPSSGIINSIQTFGSPTPSANWALVYNYGKRDCEILHQFYTSSPSNLAFNSSLVGDLNFNVDRSNNDITIDVSWEIDSVIYQENFMYNLFDNVKTEKFKDFQKIGFAFMSQDLGGFKDVVLTKPEGDFYSIVRIEPKLSQSDNTINEISTLIEAPENNLLTQVTGDLKKATLSYDGSNFIAQCLVGTALIEKGEDYDFSAELRPINLEKV